MTDTDDTPVWHLVAEVLPDDQVATMCGRVVDRAAAGPQDVGRECAHCQRSETA